MATTTQLHARLTSLPASIWDKITRIESLNGQWTGGARLGPQALGRLKRSVLVTSTGASTRIEGAQLSDADVEKLMRGISIQQFSDRDKAEVRGYFELLENVFESWRTLRLTEGLIKHFHRELLQYVEKDAPHRGDYKRSENKVHMVDAAGESVGVLFDTTPAYRTAFEMHDLVDWTRESLDRGDVQPILVIGGFLVQFLQIHPFQDGNGRVSRILTNLLMLQAGYGFVPYVSHEKIVEDNKPDYYLALRASQRTFGTPEETIVPWLDFFLDTVHEQARRALDLLTAERIEPLLSPRQLEVWEFLRHVEEAAPLEIATALDIPRPTINQVVNRLMELGKIERLGLGRGTRYRIKD